MADVPGRKAIIRELGMILILCLAVFFLAGRFDVLESVVGFSRAHEDWELDEVITTMIFLAFALAVFSFRRWQHTRILGNDLAKKNRALERALEEIGQLKGILPICASCKKIRNDQGYWDQVEAYIEAHTDARFSHSMCPDCMERFYGGKPWFEKQKQKRSEQG